MLFKSNTIISDICTTYLHVFQGGKIVLLERYNLSQIQKTITKKKKKEKQLGIMKILFCNQCKHSYWPATICQASMQRF